MEHTETPPLEIELERLSLRYAHTRVFKPRALKMLVNSLERYGQITPVICVPDGQHPVLIDGYLRVEALKRLGSDTVKGRLHECDEQHALLQLLARFGERQWEAIEQAQIIRELVDRFEYPLRAIARSIGYDISWVSRRVSLLDGLPEDLLHEVCRGRIQVFGACRVLVPLARANTSHARKLCEHLAERPMSTRELSRFFAHYRSANRKTRETMISDPSLFVKALKSKEEKASADAVQGGPEGEWLKNLSVAQAVLKRAMKAVSVVIYAGQDAQDRERLVAAYEATRSLITLIGNKITEAEQ